MYCMNQGSLQTAKHTLHSEQTVTIKIKNMMYPKSESKTAHKHVNIHLCT